jgi:hypothetical protein
MVTPRLFHFLAYLVISGALVVVQVRLSAGIGWLLGRMPGRRQWSFALLAAAILGGAGLGVWQWMKAGKPGAHSVAVAITALLAAGALFALFRRDREKSHGVLGHPLAVLLGSLLFLAPFLNDHLHQALARGHNHGKHPLRWFESRSNPLGLSGELIAWTRTLPAKQRILVYPIGKDWLSIYEPQYLAVIPCRTIPRFKAIQHQVEEGRHVLYSGAFSGAQQQQFNHEEIKAWLAQQQVDYVLINKEQYDRSRVDYFLAHAADYEVVFHQPQHREMMVRFRESGAGVRLSQNQR